MTFIEASLAHAAVLPSCDSVSSRNMLGPTTWNRRQVKIRDSSADAWCVWSRMIRENWVPRTIRESQFGWGFSAGWWARGILLCGGIGIVALVHADWPIALLLIGAAIGQVPFYRYQRRRGL